MIPSTYTNPWLTIARKRRVENDLRALFLGQSYRKVAKELTKIAYNHDDWHKTFVIYSTVGPQDLIESLEVQEIE